MVKKIVGVMFGVIMLSGCYTQFSTLQEKREPPPPQITYEIDSATGDTVKVARSVDTVMVKQNQNCYWTRNFFGEPELRCDNSMYAHDWYLYNDYPWWYRSDPYYYDNSGRCPQYYYYDASCGCCQYWGGGGFRDYNYSRGGSGGSGSGTTGNGKLRRTSSSSVISNPRAQSGLQGSAKTTTINTDVQNQKKLETMEQRRVQAKKAIEAAGSAAKEAAPENINQTPQPTRAEPVEVPRETSQPPAQSPSVQSAPNPPSGNSNPPPSNNGGSGNNDGNRRNPRSW